MRDLFTELVSQVERQGVNCSVTLHALLFSGATDAVTGQPTKGWTDSTVDMIIEPSGAPLQVFDAGLYAGLKAKASTKAALSDGDEVTDSFGNLWVVLSVLPFTVGDVAVYKQCELALGIASSYTHPAPVYPTPPIGVGAPIVLTLQCIHDTEIVYPVVAVIQCIADTEIVTPTVVAVISTIVAVTPDVPRWFIDCAYSILGTLDPTGPVLQVMASGATLAVTSTSDTANGYVQASATPFSLDDFVFHHGSVAVDGTASYTVPAQTDNTWHQLRGSFSVGWGCSSTVATPTGYSYTGSGSHRTYTAQGSAGGGSHWHILVDGNDLGNSPASVPEQTDGTYHVVTQVATPDP